MTQTPRIYALIVAAGTGTRAGSELPKQYQQIGGRSMLRHSVGQLLNHPKITGVAVVIHAEHKKLYQQAVDGLSLLPPTIGGAERSDSVACGLEALAPHGPDYVLIHDAARPFLSAAILDELIKKLTPDHAVVPVLPVPDTVRRVDGAKWEDVARDGLMRIQTPQAFPFNALHKIYDTGLGATDDAAVWLDAGYPLDYVAGDERLRKVTTADDLAWAQEQMGATRRVAVGFGYDVHALMPSGEAHMIRLGGLDIPHAHKLHGHSDADVVLHAIVDALLGTIAAGDIGSHFPPDDAKWKGADSARFVEEAHRLVKQKGGEITHIDVTVICESPKISPHRDAMRARIAEILQLPVGRVSIKATTTERLGFTGREEGIAAQAVATVNLPGYA